jgi:aspartyl-tRNA(Asn)/glutamyl-tRNA(Gln) amidotransferase subunit C
MANSKSDLSTSTSPRLDKSTVAKVAELSRLKLSDAELESISQQLSMVLANFEQLAEVNTQGVEPMVTPTDLTLRLRDDRVERREPAEAFLENAPDRSGNLFKVPPVVG